MDDSGFILLTAEAWVRHPNLANVYSEKLLYTAFRSVSAKDVHSPENFLVALLGLCSRGDVDILDADALSLATGRLSIISSDQPVIFASR